MVFPKNYFLSHNEPESAEKDFLQQAILDHNDRRALLCQGRLFLPQSLVFHCRQTTDANSKEESCQSLMDDLRGVTLGFLLAMLQKRAFFLSSSGWDRLEAMGPHTSLHVDNCLRMSENQSDVTSMIMENFAHFVMADHKIGCTWRTLKRFGLVDSPRALVSMRSRYFSHDQCWRNVLRHWDGDSFPLHKLSYSIAMSLVIQNLFAFPSARQEQLFKAFVNDNQVDMEKSVCLHLGFDAIRRPPGNGLLLNLFRCANALRMTLDVPASRQRNLTVIMVGHKASVNKVLEASVRAWNTSCRSCPGDAPKTSLVDTAGFLKKHAGEAAEQSADSHLIFSMLVLSRCQHVVSSDTTEMIKLTLSLHSGISRHVVQVQQQHSHSESLQTMCVPLKLFQ